MNGYGRCLRGAISRCCESVFPFVRAAGVLLAIAVVIPASSLASPEDDYKRGELASRSGDVVEAMAALKRAADQGHTPAQVLLGDILDRAEFDEEAMVYYRKAAEQGDPGGEFGVGSMYLSGEGVKKDPEQAFMWITRAAEKKFPRAIMALAGAYLSAENKSDAASLDPARAGEWLRKAAEIDYAPAVEALARAYLNGGYGLAPDKALAARYAAQLTALGKKKGGDGRKKK